MFIEKLVRTLEKHRVRYVLVGGVAVALHGAIRGTVDIDVAIPLTKTAFLAAETALRSLGLESRLPVTAAEVFSFREEYVRNRNLTAWSFVNSANPLEIVDILIAVDSRKLKTVTKHVRGLAFRVVALPDLIAMKKISGRSQDLEDIRALEMLS